MTIPKRQECEQFNSRFEPTCEHLACYENWFAHFVSNDGTEDTYGYALESGEEDYEY